MSGTELAYGGTAEWVDKEEREGEREREGEKEEEGEGVGEMVLHPTLSPYTRAMRCPAPTLSSYVSGTDVYAMLLCHV
eukprot:3940797-Rhodomonas_salina.1